MIWTAINRLSAIWKLDVTDKTQFFLSSGRIHTAVWMHYMDTNKTYGEKAWQQLHRNVAINIEQVTETASHKASAVRPLTTHHDTFQVTRTRHVGHCWGSRDELKSDIFLWTPSHGRPKSRRPARTYIEQICADTGCRIEDLQEAIDDREVWRERFREICASGMT